MASIKEDPTNPNHYNRLGDSVIELTEKLGFLEGNIVKYIARHQDKNGKEDLEKALWYLKRLMEKDYAEIVVKSSAPKFTVSGCFVHKPLLGGCYPPECTED